MECYKVIHYEPHFSEDELNHILNSSLFKKAFYAFAKRNPYYARTLFYHDSISVIANLCEIAVYGLYPYYVCINEDNLSTDDFEIDYDDLESFGNPLIDSLNYDYLITENEPFPMNDAQIFDMLASANIILDWAQRKAVTELVSNITPEECNMIIERCRETVKTFGWFTSNMKPLFDF